MAVRVIVNGASGKMGSMACRALGADPRFEVVATLGRGAALAQDIQRTQAAVVLDLTRADVVYEHAKIIIDAGARPVIGTSGLTPEQIEALTQRCARLERGGVIAPNFSIGVLLMMRFSALAAPFFPAVEIIEMHHAQKFDSPSGTAIKTAAMIESRRTESPQTGPVEASRGAIHHGIPIHALRLPGVLAKQTVLFGGIGETLAITHDSLDRQCFMPGILLACERVMSLQTLKYGLEHLIDGWE